MGCDGLDVGGNSGARGGVKPRNRQHNRRSDSHAVTLNRNWNQGNTRSVYFWADQPLAFRCQVLAVSYQLSVAQLRAKGSLSSTSLLFRHRTWLYLIDYNMFISILL